MNEVETVTEVNNSSSLSMFGAAVGGAVLGMLLTLLVLAIINGGTLSFNVSQSDQFWDLSSKVQRIDENLNAINYNLNVVAEDVDELQNE